VLAIALGQRVTAGSRTGLAAARPTSMHSARRSHLHPRIPGRKQHRRAAVHGEDAGKQRLGFFGRDIRRTHHRPRSHTTDSCRLGIPSLPSASEDAVYALHRRPRVSGVLPSDDLCPRPARDRHCADRAIRGSRGSLAARSPGRSRNFNPRTAGADQYIGEILGSRTSGKGETGEGICKM